MTCDVLFYTSYTRAFSYIYAGHIYELAKKYSVVVLTEPMDAATRGFLLDKTLFPGVREIVPVEQYRSGESLLAKNFRLSRAAESLISRYRPSVVVATSDYASLFELYLLRLAKAAGVRRVTVCGSASAESRISGAWLEAYKAELYFKPLPRPLRQLLVRLRAWFGHFLVYWALPLLAGRAPFPGQSSFVLFRGQSGMRDSECQVLFSERDRAVSLADRVPPSRLAVVSHPIVGAARHIFERLHRPPAEKRGPVAVALYPSETFGFDGDLRPIDRRVYKEAQSGALMDMVRVLKGWRVLVKPHPVYVSKEAFLEACGPLPEGVEVIDPALPVEPYIMQADLVADLPRAASTATYFATLARPGAIVAALDFCGEYLGDYHRNTIGVSYIRTREDWRALLASARVVPDQARPQPLTGDYPDLPSLLRDRFGAPARRPAEAEER